MAIVIKHTDLTANLAITEFTDGFWLYDVTRGMNLAVQAKTEQEAFVEAITYYQSRLTEVESNHRCLTQRVEAFVSQFTEDEE